MQRRIMLEKRCKIGFRDADFLEIKCKNCSTTCNVAMDSITKFNSCPVCGCAPGVELQNYLRTISNIKFSLDKDFDISLVSVCDEK